MTHRDEAVRSHDHLAALSAQGGDDSAESITLIHCAGAALVGTCPWHSLRPVLSMPSLAWHAPSSLQHSMCQDEVGPKARTLLAKENTQDQARRIFGRGKRKENHQLGSSSSLPSPIL